MEQVAVEIQQAVNQSITGMEAQRTAFEASASQASQTFRGIREDLQAALNTQAEQQKQMLQDVQTSTESILIKANDAFQNQSNTLVTVGKEASGLMSEAKDNFLGTLNSIDGMLQNTRVVIEGNTSSKGSDQGNMELSLRRALSVSNYIFSQQINFDTKNQFKQKILASGRGEIDADKSKDNSSDRKVVFRFQFRREDFGELLKRANTVKNSVTK